VIRDSVEVLLLGAAQDAGLPHCGCQCDNCTAARADPRREELPTSIAVIDHAHGSHCIIDATPAFPRQLEMVERSAGRSQLRGVFVTHAHIGHYTGLMYLGREAMNTEGIPVYASDRVCSLLRENAPWSQLVSLGNIALMSMAEGEPVQVTPGISVRSIAVPHRGEFSDTHAFIIGGPAQSLLYCPDVDQWELWENDLRALLSDTDHALLDGTFFSRDELPEELMSEVPHPAVEDTCEMMHNFSNKVTFVHMNHSNPLHRDGPEREFLLKRGFQIGKRGQRWELGKQDGAPPDR
jgi:pyrroloquinoline quinone biosynthesis protein B